MGFEDLVNMDKSLHHGDNTYFQKKELTPKEIHAGMVANLEDDTLALSTVKNWAADVKSLEDFPRSGHPSTSTTQENIDCIHQMVIDYRRLTVNHIANVMSISREQTFSTRNVVYRKFWLNGCPGF